MESMAFMIAAFVELGALSIAAAIVCSSPQPMCRGDRNDALGIAIMGTVLAGLLAASHFVLWPQW